MFSKFIHATPLRIQDAPSISKALSESWLYLHGMPRYLLSDQGSNVDGETIRSLCAEFKIEKRRTSAYHSQGNGFAERNIRNVKEIIRSVLHHRKLRVTKWRSVLSELVFALNCSTSSAIKCVPYKVVFGRTPHLPVDNRLGIKESLVESVSPQDYSAEVNLSLGDVFSHVEQYLKISKDSMQKQYNKRLRVMDYKSGDRVWMTTRFFKSVESRKLSPRRNGPWTILERLPNGVNFRVRHDRSREEKVVHHDRLYPVKGGEDLNHDQSSEPSDSDSDTDFDEATSSVFSPEDAASSDELSDSPAASRERRYPARDRVQREIPGAIPWDVVRL